LSLENRKGENATHGGGQHLKNNKLVDAQKMEEIWVRGEQQTVRSAKLKRGELTRPNEQSDTDSPILRDRRDRSEKRKVTHERISQRGGKKQSTGV